MDLSDLSSLLDRLDRLDLFLLLDLWVLSSRWNLLGRLDLSSQFQSGLFHLSDPWILSGPLLRFLQSHLSDLFFQLPPSDLFRPFRLLNL